MCIYISVEKFESFHTILKTAHKTHFFSEIKYGGEKL